MLLYKQRHPFADLLAPFRYVFEKISGVAYLEFFLEILLLPLIIIIFLFRYPFCVSVTPRGGSSFRDETSCDIYRKCGRLLAVSKKLQLTKKRGCLPP